MTAVATLSRRFRLSVPQAVCDAHHWKAGQQLAFLPKDGGVLLVPVPRIDELIGIVKVAEDVDYRDRTRRDERY